MASNTIYDFSAKTITGQELSLSELKGKVLLIVNTASKCGLTPQYKGLEELHQQYGEKGLVIIGFPCNQFGGQEPGAEDEIASFCQVNYGVSFQMMSKVDVNGKNADPIFSYLKNNSNSGLIKMIKWNFTKFLVSADGQEIKRYGPTVSPDSIGADIERMLQDD